MNKPDLVKEILTRLYTSADIPMANRALQALKQLEAERTLLERMDKLEAALKSLRDELYWRR